MSSEESLNEVPHLRESLAQLERNLVSLEFLLQHIHERMASPPPKNKDWWDKSQILATVLTPLLAGFLGYLLITTVNLSLQKQQIQLSGAKEMQGLLADLGNPDSTSGKAQASAVALASFGRFAIVPLINELQTGTLNGQVGAVAGLHALGVEDPEETCTQLVRTIENRSRLYSWITHRYALRLLGELNCGGAVQPLQTYRQLLGADDAKSVEAYSKVVAEDPSPTLENLTNVKAEVDRSLTILEALHAH
jgi:hypothetical protein